MYRSFYKLREKPFSLLPDPAFLYVSSKHRKALAKLRSGILNRAGMTVITGEIGSGKTTLIQHLVRELESEVTIGLINNVHARFDDLLGWVLQAFDIEVPDSSEAKLHGAFVNFVKDQASQGGRALLFIDETQNMPAAVLEELRLLMNINIDYPAFEVVLVGQPELRDVLEQPDMRQFAQRVAVEHHLQPLDAEETGQYIQHRLTVAGGNAELFDAEACELIYQRSHGVPRLVNSLCDTVLEYGFDQQRESIDGPLVQDILNDSANRQLLALAEPYYISKVLPTVQAESAKNLTNLIDDRRFTECAQSRMPASRQAPGRHPGNLDEALNALSDFLD